MRKLRVFLCIFALASASASAQGIQQWKTPDGKLFFGDRPPPGSTLVGGTESMGTSGGGDVAEPDAAAPARAARTGIGPRTADSDEPVNAGVALSKRDRLYFDTWSQRGLSSSELEIVERNLNAVRNDVGRDLRVASDARFQVVLTEPEVFHRYSGTREQVSGLFNGKIHIPIPNGISESELQGTLWHEYSHAVIFTKSGTRCPHWLNEGIASHQEAKINPMRRQNRAMLVTDGKLRYSWPDLDRALTSQTASHADQDLAYRQALAIVDYLYERYSNRRVNDLLDQLGSGSDVETALRETMHTTLDRLAKDVIDYVRGG